EDPVPASIARRGAIAARIEAPGAHAALLVDGKTLRMPGEFVPIGPALEPVAAARQLVERLARETAFDVQRIARLAEREAAREPARRRERRLDIEPVVDQRH